MFTITLANLKGGVGKTSLAILIQSYLVQNGYKVLCIDYDFQNALSFYFDKSVRSEKNIYEALFTGNLKNNILNDLFSYWIQADFKLTELRSDNDVFKLKNILKTIENDFDFVVIDCSPTWDNLVLQACISSDIILSPTQIDLFNWKTLMFFKGKLKENDLLDKWRVVYNRYRPAVSDNSPKNDYNNLFIKHFKDHVLNSYLPTNSGVKRKIDDHSRINNTNPIFIGINNLIKEIGIKSNKEINYI